MKEGWEVKKLGEVCRFDKIKNETVNLPYVGLEHIESNTGKFIGSMDTVQVKSSTFYFSDKHLLYGRLRPYLNKVLIPKFEGHCSTEIFPIKVSDDVLREFLFHWFTSEETVGKINSTCTGARMPRANMNEVINFQIPIPPISEQKQIVAILDEAFAAIDQAKANIEKNIENANELFQSKLNEIFSQKGEGWEESKIENLTELITKGSSPKWQGINYVKKPGILFVTSGNVGDGELLMKNRKYLEEEFNSIEKKSILKKGDVLTNLVGASIGRTAIFDLDEVANINQAVCLMRCRENELHNEYLMYLLNSPYFKQILHDNEVNNARANLSLAFFRKLIIPFPNIKNQAKIVSEIKILNENISELIQNYEYKVHNLDQLKSSLLQKAFGGELT